MTEQPDVTDQTDPPTLPSSTYRLHLTGAFTLHDAAALVDHVDRLGADWMYASPIQTVPEGATHGYHLLDPDAVNPELGGDDGLAALDAALRTAGRGLLLDIVPNHMAASPANPWWADVLRHGAGSDHATTFDIGFDDPTGRLAGDGPDAVPAPPGGHDPTAVVLPVLDADRDRPWPSQVRLDAEADPPAVVVGDGFRLPLAPGTDLDAPLEEVLAAQAYRLLPWPLGSATINWRRFFAVNELVGLRVEDPAVFDATHRMILRLVADGIVGGLRVDHIDGLVDPDGYLQRLRDRVGPAATVLVEKILEQGEPLPPWPVQGTTGYEVAALICAWQVDPDGLRSLQQSLASRGGPDRPAPAALVEARRWALEALFPAEVARVAGMVAGLLPDGHQDPAGTAREGVVALASHLHGYRTYARPVGPLLQADVDRLRAAALAASRADTASRAADAASGATDADSPAAAVAEALLHPDGRPALLRFQQLTGPATAKGFEDRLLYQHVALASLCEVGADPALLDAPPAAADIPRLLAARQVAWPHAGTTTSTHDTKRSEDVRCRIAVLSEVPDALADLADLLDATRPAPPTEGLGTSRWLLLQTVLGTVGLVEDGPALRDRLSAYMAKATEEAGWPDPDPLVAVLSADVAALTGGDPDLTAAVNALVERIAIPGMVNSAGLVTLKLLGPGIPDVYRGTEVLDDSLVDPDNRRPLRTDVMAAALTAAEAAMAAEDPALAVAGLRDRWRDGALKLHVTRAGLHLRRHHAATLLDGPVLAPDVTGPARDHVAALRRTPPDGDGPAITAVTTRLPLRLSGAGWPVGPVWGDTHLAADRPVTDVLTGRRHTPSSGWLALAEVLDVLPVAMLVDDDDR